MVNVAVVTRTRVRTVSQSVAYAPYLSILPVFGNGMMRKMQNILADDCTYLLLEKNVDIYFASSLPVCKIDGAEFELVTKWIPVEYRIQCK